MEHWNPDDDAVPLSRLCAVSSAPPEDRARRKQRRLPHGARAGLAIVALGCAAIAGGMYQVLGPDDVFASEDAPIDWSAVEKIPGSRGSALTGR